MVGKKSEGCPSRTGHHVGGVWNGGEGEECRGWEGKAECYGLFGGVNNGAEPRIFVSEAPSGDWANHPLVAPDDRALNTYRGSPMESREEITISFLAMQNAECREG